jgi:hypothetical protein
MTIAQLQAEINLYIKQNGIKAITGSVLNTILNDMVTTLNADSIGSFAQSFAPASGEVGDIWYNTNDKKLYRYIIVFENNDLLFIKNCDGKIKILNSQEQEHCNKNRKTL